MLEVISRYLKRKNNKTPLYIQTFKEQKEKREECKGELNYLNS